MLLVVYCLIQESLTRKNGALMNYEVPPIGTPWKHGDPSADDLRIAALQALGRKPPGIDKPPYDFLLCSKKGKWGPTESAGWTVIYSVPYVSAQIAVELNWAIGKNYVANPIINSWGKSVARVINMLRHAW